MVASITPSLIAFATIYSVSDIDSMLSLAHISPSEIREYDREIFRKANLITLCRNLRLYIRLPLNQTIVTISHKKCCVFFINLTKQLDITRSHSLSNQ